MSRKRHINFVDKKTIAIFCLKYYEELHLRINWIIIKYIKFQIGYDRLANACDVNEIVNLVLKDKSKRNNFPNMFWNIKLNDTVAIRREKGNEVN